MGKSHRAMSTSLVEEIKATSGLAKACIARLKLQTIAAGKKKSVHKAAPRRPRRQPIRGRGPEPYGRQPPGRHHGATLAKVQSPKMQGGWPIRGAKREGLMRGQGGAVGFRRGSESHHGQACARCAAAPPTRRRGGRGLPRRQGCNGYFTPYRANSSAISLLMALAAPTSSAPVASPFFRRAEPRPYSAYGFCGFVANAAL